MKREHGTWYLKIAGLWIPMESLKAACDIIYYKRRKP